MKIIVISVFVIVCLLKTSLLSSIKAEEGLCIIAIIIVRSSALPVYFYEMMEEIDDANPKELYRTTRAAMLFKPTPLTSEAPIPDEWQLRGVYRLKCVEETGVGPLKVVTTVSKAVNSWDEEEDLKRWMLCVLNKMDLMSMQGVFKMDVAMSKIYNKNKQDAESLINHCLPKRKMPAHEIAWRYVKCHSLARGNFSAISVF